MFLSFVVVDSSDSVLSTHVILPSLRDKCLNLNIILHLLNVTKLYDTGAMLFNQIPMLLHFLNELTDLLKGPLFIAFVGIDEFKNDFENIRCLHSKESRAVADRIIL